MLSRHQHAFRVRRASALAAVRHQRRCRQGHAPTTAPPRRQRHLQTPSRLPLQAYAQDAAVMAISQSRGHAGSVFHPRPAHPNRAAALWLRQSRPWAAGLASAMSLDYSPPTARNQAATATSLPQEFRADQRAATRQSPLPPTIDTPPPALAAQHGPHAALLPLDWPVPSPAASNPPPGHSAHAALGRYRSRYARRRWSGWFRRWTWRE